MRTFQSRLAAKQNKIAQKLSDNAISLLGTATDVIKITSKKNNMGDLISRTVNDIDVIEIIFPGMVDVPMWRFTKDGVSGSSHDIHSGDIQPFVLAAPLSSRVDQDDILIKFFEDPAGDNPFVLVLQIKDVLGTFGGRSIIYQKMNASYYDEQLEPEIWQWCIEIAERRNLLKW